MAAHSAFAAEDAPKDPAAIIAMNKADYSKAVLEAFKVGDHVTVYVPLQLSGKSGFVWGNSREGLTS